MGFDSRTDEGGNLAVTRGDKSGARKGDAMKKIERVNTQYGGGCVHRIQGRAAMHYQVSNIWLSVQVFQPKGEGK